MLAVNFVSDFFPIKGKSKLYHIRTQTLNRCDKLVWESSPLPPSPIYSKSAYSLAFLARTCAVWKTHLLSLLLCKWLHELGSVSLAWVFLCLRNLDAVLVQSGAFVVLNSFQLEGCASNDVRWSPVPLFASSLASHQCSSPLATHLQESCHFLFLFLFFTYWICFPFSFVVLFCWRLIAV